jgi:plasmid stabilization system protein ParE
MKRRVSLHPLARAEADAQLDWYLDRSIEAAAGFITELNRLIETIADNPSSYPPYE